MNFYDVLAAEKWDGGIPTTNFFDLLFAQSISGEQWQTYEGTLPATLNANGDDMHQYQIWGNVGGVGDDSGTVYGYEVDISISDGTNTTTTPIYIGDDPLDKGEYVDYQAGKVLRLSENLWDINGTTTNQKGEERPGNEFESGYTYKIYNGSNILIYFRFGKQSLIGSDIPAKSEVIVFATDLLVVWATNSSLMNKITAQRLTPTDPPVPLPALPTYKGTTTVDYAGGGAAPEKVYFEYQGGRQP